MAEQAAQEKTEQPTAKRRQDAVDKGNVAKSQELNSVAVLVAGMLAFKVTGVFFRETFQRFVVTTYQESSLMDISIQSIPAQMGDFMRVFGMLMLPILILLVLASLASNYAQVGFIFAKKALMPDFKKLNPFSGLKRMFSSKALVELFKGIFKLTIVGLIGYFVLAKHAETYFLLPNKTTVEIIAFAFSIVVELTIKVGIALLLMAIADFGYQKWDHEKKLKMTKQEVKDEMKQSEGDPLIKGRIRSAQRQLAMNRMMQAVPEATVVVTNPTHIAVALKYEPEKSSDAPMVIAKGKEKIAERIKSIARDHEIPVIEDKPLARGIFESCEIGMEIPIVFYQAVAEILSQVYQASKKNMPLVGDLNG